MGWAKLVLPVWLDLSDTPKVKVAKVDASVSLSDYGSPATSKEPLQEVNSSTLTKAKYSQGFEAIFRLKNSGSEPLKDARVGVVCYSSGKIIGGSSSYPSLIAPGKTVRLAVPVTTSGKPDRCRAFPNYSTI